jgi:hypothetical protein
MNIKKPNLPQEVIDAQTKIAKIFTTNENLNDLQSEIFIRAWLNGYYSAMLEVGAIDEDDTDGENDLLRQMNNFSKVSYFPSPKPKK